MTLQITGKNVDAGPAFQNYVTDKLLSVLEKYIGPELAGHVRLEKEKSRFRTDCSIRLRSGILLEAHGEAGDAYASADAAVERLETRVRRHKRRLKNHHNGRPTGTRTADATVADYVVEMTSDERADEPSADHPVIIAETVRDLQALSVSEAVMQLDLTDNTFFVFRNAAHGGLNVVYRRPDGHIGWMDPQPTVS